MYQVIKNINDLSLSGSFDRGDKEPLNIDPALSVQVLYPDFETALANEPALEAYLQIKADPRTAKQRARDSFLALPVEVQAAFLTEWAAINNALELGAKPAALVRFDSLVVPPELVSAKAEIRSNLEVA